MKRLTAAHASRPDFPCDRYVLTVRDFLARVSAEIRGTAPAPTAGASPWDAFTPTTIRLVSVVEDPTVSVTCDVDSQPRPRFVTGIKAVERVRYYASARMQQVAVRSYLAPLALVPERGERNAHFDSVGYPLHVPNPSHDLSSLVYQRLTRRERYRASYIPLDEQVALAAILVAEKRPVAAFSSDGRWPRHALVGDVASRLRCTIVRRSLAEVPKPVQRQIRFLRYFPEELLP